LLLSSAWSSSITTARNVANCARAAGSASISASDSGVVMRKCGGFSRWRTRLACGVSPVRDSARTGSASSAIGISRLRCTSTASAFSGET
jgi:hypothetical protein